MDDVDAATLRHEIERLSARQDELQDQVLRLAMALLQSMTYATNAAAALSSMDDETRRIAARQADAILKQVESSLAGLSWPKADDPGQG